MPGAGETRSAQQYLADLELDWRRRLRLVSLVAEMLDEISAGDCETAIALIGNRYANLQGSARIELLHRWPAVHVVSTAYTAAERYDHGGIWPQLKSLINTATGQAFNEEWGGAFLRNLEYLSMPTFSAQGDEAGQRYVGRVLLHSGVPTACLDDYFRLVNERRHAMGGLTPDALVAWVIKRASERRLYNVDRPVERFLRYGGEFATDVTDRVFDLLDSVAAGGDGRDIQVPERFRLKALALHEQGQLAQAPAKGSTRDAVVQPHLAVDPFGRGVLLRLPAVGDAPDGSAVWSVGLDAVVQRVATKALWPGANEPAPQTDVPIPHPIRLATAALFGKEHLQARIPVVDDADPILPFGEDGVHLPAIQPLPASPVWILFPGDGLDSLHISGDTTLLAESPLPPGWTGWCLLLLDLSHVKSVQLTGRESVHTVRRDSIARVSTPDAVLGIRTTAGLPIYPELPRIELPEGLSEAKWRIDVLDSDGDSLARWNSDEGSRDPNTVWSQLSRPFLGTISVRVQGPWGRGLTRTVAVAEGLSARFEPRWRRFSPGGLQPCTITVATHPGMTSTRSRIDLTERQRGVTMQLSVGIRALRVQLTPPHMSVAYESTDGAPISSIRPLTLLREEVREAPGTFILNVGAQSDPMLYAIGQAGHLQTLEPSAGRAGVYRFSLSRLVDTLGTHAFVQLCLSPDGALNVATIRPRRLHRGISIEQHNLVFSECVDVEGLSALIYSLRAPWRETVALPIFGGRAELPEWLRDAGPMAVMTRIEDPWVPEPVPVWPDRQRAFFVDADGWIADDDPEENALSAFLAGVSPLPDHIADFRRLWTARGLIAGLALGEQRSAIEAALDSAIHASPRRALLALGASKAPGSSIPSLLIMSGLAWANLISAHDDRAPEWSVRDALPAALLSAADAEWSPDEIDAATAVCGREVAEILVGQDHFAAAGRLDASADLFDREPTMREDFIRHAGLIPRGLLSGDSRVVAAMELVRERRDPRLKQLLDTSRRLFEETRGLLRLIGDPATIAAFEARRHATAAEGWRVLPALSLGWSLAARHAARGNSIAAAWLGRQRRCWSDLGEVVPQLVTIDLILAELVVASVSAQSTEVSE